MKRLRIWLASKLIGSIPISFNTTVNLGYPESWIEYDNVYLVKTRFTRVDIKEIH